MNQTKPPINNIKEYKDLIYNRVRRNDITLSFEEMLQVDILRQLIALNNKLGFIVAVIIIGFILTLIFGR